MESLWKLYEERLNQLNDTFLSLLEQFEDNSLFTTSQLSKYRVEYLAEIIEKTLKNSQQKLILKLYQEIDQLKTNNIKLYQQLKQGGKVQQINGNELQVNEKSLGSTKVSTVGKRKQGENEWNDIFLGGVRQKGRRQGSKRVEMRSGRKVKQNEQYEQHKMMIKERQKDMHNRDQQMQRYGQDEDEDKELSMMSSAFKYLRL